MSREPTNPLREGTLLALLAAAAFGTTTPLVQNLGRTVAPFTTASLLYVGAALATFGFGTGNTGQEASVRARHLPRLFAVAALGAFLAPTLLAWSLQHTSAARASLLLNFEALFTVLIGWAVFREHVGRRVIVALGFMLAGGVCLAPKWSSGQGPNLGVLAVVGATLAWALDNVCTRPLADLNPTHVVRGKAAIGALLAFSASRIWGEPLPTSVPMLGLLFCGATGYGLSLRLYLLAQRRVGAGRTASVFALAPFLGASLAFLMGDRPPLVSTSSAALLFGVGVFLHLTERHSHEHIHAAIEHEHAHRHDDGHHLHTHDAPVLGAHSHVHRHSAQIHGHPHGPDVHHQHRHRS